MSSYVMIKKQYKCDRIWIFGPHHFTPIMIEFPNQRRICLKCYWSR